MASELAGMDLPASYLDALHDLDDQFGTEQPSGQGPKEGQRQIPPREGGSRSRDDLGYEDDYEPEYRDRSQDRVPDMETRRGEERSASRATRELPRQEPPEFSADLKQRATEYGLQLEQFDSSEALQSQLGWCVSWTQWIEYFSSEANKLSSSSSSNSTNNNSTISNRRNSSRSTNSSRRNLLRSQQVGNSSRSISSRCNSSSRRRNNKVR